MTLRKAGRCMLALACALLAACANQPPTPDWQLQAHAASQRAVQAWLSGQDRIAEQEWTRARQETSRTGNLALMARLELLHCAAQVASLQTTNCPAYQALQADAAPAEQAYAAYLRGQTIDAAQADLLPAHQKAVALGADLERLDKGAEPLAQLVAAGVLQRRGLATQALAQQATEWASAQGWRRPLLAWLGLQWRMAEQQGNTQEAAQLQRRMQAVLKNGKP